MTRSGELQRQSAAQAEYARALEYWQLGQPQRVCEVLQPLLGPAQPQQLPAAALLIAALLRLGQVAAAQALLSAWPPQEEMGEGWAARRSVLLARAAYLQASASAQANATRAAEAATLARQARAQAQHAGDVGALLGAVILLGELQLAFDLPEAAGTRPRGFAALHILAQGLRVTEATASPPDAHLLSVLAAAQRFMGPAKARSTAAKALGLSLPGSPARVGALLLLGRSREAAEQQQASGLAAGWLRVFEEGT